MLWGLESGSPVLLENTPVLCDNAFVEKRTRLMDIIHKKNVEYGINLLTLHALVIK